MMRKDKEAMEQFDREFPLKRDLRGCKSGKQLRFFKQEDALKNMTKKLVRKGVVVDQRLIDLQGKHDADRKIKKVGAQEAMIREEVAEARKMKR